MEKHTAHYPLDTIKSVIMQKGPHDAFTRTAKAGLLSMGLTVEEACNVVLSLTPRLLQKSMTTHADHRIWQDVYYAPCPNGKTAYIKLTLQDGAVVIQFKEK